MLGLIEHEQKSKRSLERGAGYDDTGIAPKASGKKILAIHEKISREIEQNIVRADGEGDDYAIEQAR